MITLYTLKPRFQALLRPLVGRLARARVTADQVTIAAALGSMAIGLVIVLAGGTAVFPAVADLAGARMALSAIDGMLAQEFGHGKIRSAPILNELGDVVSDSALYIVRVPFHPF